MEGFEKLLGVNPWTALFILLNTLIIFFVAKKFLYKPVMNMIHERQKEIDSMYENADSAKKQAETMQNEYREKLNAAQETSERIVKEAVVRGQNREDEIVRQAKEEADALRDKAAADIAQEKKKAINEAKNEISGMAVEIAGKVVGRSLTDEDQSKLVDSFIEELGDEV